MHCNQYKGVVDIQSIYAYSNTSLYKPAMGITLNGPFMEVVGLGSYNGVTMVLYGDRLEWLICGGGRLERF